MQSPPDFLWSLSGLHSFSIHRPECFKYLNQIPAQGHSPWGHTLPFEVWPFMTAQLTLATSYPSGLSSNVLCSGRPFPPPDHSRHPAPSYHSWPVICTELWHHWMFSSLSISSLLPSGLWVPWEQGSCLIHCSVPRMVPGTMHRHSTCSIWVPKEGVSEWQRPPRK